MQDIITVQRQDKLSYSAKEPGAMFQSTRAQLKRFKRWTVYYLRWVRITWTPSRTRTRCGDGNQALQFASFASALISEKLVGILITAIASIDSVDCIPETFLITAELTCTIRTDKSSIHSGISQLSGRSKQSIITVFSSNDFWNSHISLKVRNFINTFHLSNYLHIYDRITENKTKLGT